MRVSFGSFTFESYQKIQNLFGFRSSVHVVSQKYERSLRQSFISPKNSKIVIQFFGLFQISVKITDTYRPRRFRFHRIYLSLCYLNFIYLNFTPPTNTNELETDNYINIETVSFSKKQISSLSRLSHTPGGRSNLSAIENAKSRESGDIMANPYPSAFLRILIITINF